MVLIILTFVRPMLPILPMSNFADNSSSIPLDHGLPNEQLSSQTSSLNDPSNDPMIQIIVKINILTIIPLALQLYSLTS